MGRRLLILLSLAAVAVLAAAASASARTSYVTISPAAGAPGTALTVTGAGFPARRRATVKLSGASALKLRVSRSGAFTARLTVPSSALGNLNLVTKTRGRRVLNRFAVATGAGAVSEVSTSKGQRLRWTIRTDSIALQGRGFAKRKRLRLRWLGRTVTLRTNSRGRFLTALRLPASGSSHPVGIRVGSLRLRFRVVGSFGSSNPIGGAGTPAPGGGGGGTPSNPPAPVVKPPPAGSPPTPPQNNVLPRANGSATTGSTLTADPGTWTGTAPINFSFRWRRCNSVGSGCSNISGATGQTYTVKSADGGHTLRVAVTATNPVDTVTAASDATALVPGPPPPPPPSGEAAHWSMESTGTMVDSIGDADGTTHSISLAAGSSGQGYSFNGSNSYAIVPSSTASELDPGTQDFTVTVHMKPNGLPNPGDEDADIIRKGVYAGSPGEFKMEYYPNGKMLCGFKGTGPTGYKEVGGEENLPGNPTLSLGTWHTVQCIKTATQIKMVVDGQTFTKSANLGSISNSDDILIGVHAPGSEVFNGVLDEIGIKIG